MSARRTTQKDVAQKAGVHRTTVSLALRGHLGIPAETRDRIQKIAAELGYTPDPVLSALTAYRQQQRSRAFQGTLAWLTNSANAFNWRESLHYRLYYDGAAARAQFHGYRLEVIDPFVLQVSTKRLLAILKAKNISGILLCPQPHDLIDLSFPWEKFFVVTFGYSLKTLRVHTVTSAHYSHAQKAMREIYRRGYRRPGLVIDTGDDLRNEHNIYAAYLVEHARAGIGKSLPPYFYFTENPDGVRQWISRHKPDAILTNNHAHLYAGLLKRGYSVPGDVALVNITLPQQDAVLTGFIENDEAIGMHAMDILVAMMQRGERQSDSSLTRTLIEGEWNEGTTLPKCV